MKIFVIPDGVSRTDPFWASNLSNYLSGALIPVDNGFLSA